LAAGWWQDGLGEMHGVGRLIELFAINVAAPTIYSGVLTGGETYFTTT
jgi:hypothetical protein